VVTSVAAGDLKGRSSRLTGQSCWQSGGRECWGPARLGLWCQQGWWKVPSVRAGVAARDQRLHGLEIDITIQGRTRHEGTRGDDLPTGQRKCTDNPGSCWGLILGR